MKGDFSRIRYNPASQYTSVLKQQGRVDLDADSNEQRFIDERMRATVNTDVIGPCGAPEDDPGFAIEISGNDIVIGKGRFYVDGILAENPTPIHYDSQHWLVEPSSTASDLLDQLLNGSMDGSLSFVLEVWQRMVTALDDRCLVEPALDRADTTARLQTVWRVIGAYDPGVSRATDNSGASRRIAYQLPPLDAGPFQVADRGTASPANSPIDQLSPCCQALYSNRIQVAIHGEMGADVNKDGSGCGCQPIPAAGYQGLENQLYRVEIHQTGDLSSATFKWSRENASVVASIKHIGLMSSIVTVDSLGPDANLGFQPNQWVEITDDATEFGDPPNQPGSLFKIVSIDPTSLQVTLDSPVFGIDPRRHARMRRWDQPITTRTSAGISVSATPIPLENGIEVSFRGRNFEAGDYWTIPARTASGEIDWPPCGKGRSYFQPPDFIAIHRAPVACVNLRTESDRIYRKGITGTAEDKTNVNDCRLLFPPLTWLTPDPVPQALHISSVSWSNDDILTVDSLLANGLSVTFDQPTTCPWGGGNFQVQLEIPFTSGTNLANLDKKLTGAPRPSFKFPPGTDCFLRSVLALDPPFGIVVSGSQVSWISAPTTTGSDNRTIYALLEVLNFLLLLRDSENPSFARVRVRLIGSSVYTSANNGNIYLDGQSFGDTSSRQVDSSPCVSLTTPSGDKLAVSDYESWFYLAPTVFVDSVVIQGVDNGHVVKSPLAALKVSSDSQGNLTGLQISETSAINGVQALITLSYAPVASVVVNLALNPVSGPTASSVASIASSVTVPAGQKTITTPITILSNPGAGNTDVISVGAHIVVLGYSLTGSATPPQLSISGSTPAPSSKSGGIIWK